MNVWCSQPRIRAVSSGITFVRINSALQALQRNGRTLTSSPRSCAVCLLCLSKRRRRSLAGAGTPVASPRRTGPPLRHAHSSVRFERTTRALCWLRASISAPGAPGRKRCQTPGREGERDKVSLFCGGFTQLGRFPFFPCRPRLIPSASRSGASSSHSAFRIALGNIIARLAERIDARQFNPAFPQTFPRFVQRAIWQYCAQDGLDVCNGNRINDARRCSNMDCRGPAHV
jgi:hypothetical protein